jgi:hypothetical protein
MRIKGGREFFNAGFAADYNLTKTPTGASWVFLFSYET